MVQNNLGQFLNVLWFVCVLLVLPVPVKQKADDKVLFEKNLDLEFLFKTNFNQCSLSFVHFYLISEC